MKREFEATTKAISPAERTVDVVMSTESPDRAGDIVRLAGLQVEQFKKNPVVLWAHDSSCLPIAQVIPESITVSGGQLLATVKFASYEFADLVFNLFREGFMKAWSIGFRVCKYAAMERGWDILESELVELSAVPVPCNPDALSKRLGGETVPAAVRLRKDFSMQSREELIQEASDLLVRLGHTREKALELSDPQRMADAQLVERIKAITEGLKASV